MFYTFVQNNSGGAYHRDATVDEYVIIEGISIEQVTDRAQDIGVYFDGCDRGLDCECCGDRWHVPFDDSELNPVPSTYGTPVEEIATKRTRGMNVIIHFANGTVGYGKHKDRW